MNQFGVAGNHPVEEDGSEGDALDGTLSLADTLEEDRERHQDVIRTLTEFEEERGAEELASPTPA
jgi:hypothetical protein